MGNTNWTLKLPLGIKDKEWNEIGLILFGVGLQLLLGMPILYTCLFFQLIMMLL